MTLLKNDRNKDKDRNDHYNDDKKMNTRPEDVNKEANGARDEGKIKTPLELKDM